MTRAVRAGGPAAVWAGLATIYLVWGSTYLAIRLMVETVPPLLGAGVRFAVAGLLLGGWLVARHGWSRIRITRRQLLGCAIVGVLLMFGGNGLVTVAERHVPSGLAALLIASEPLWIVVLRMATRERISRGTIVGLVVGFVGVAILLLPGSRPSGVAIGGLLVLLLAALFWALGSWSQRTLSLPKDVLSTTAWQMICGGLFMVILAVPTGEIAGFHAGEASAKSLAAFAYLIFIGSIVAFSAYAWLLRNAPISKVSTYAYVNPVVAVFLGWAFLSETVTPLTLLGAAVIVASVAVIVRAEREPAPAPAPAGAEEETQRRAAETVAA